MAHDMHRGRLITVGTMAMQVHKRQSPPRQVREAVMAQNQSNRRQRHPSTTGRIILAMEKRLTPPDRIIYEWLYARVDVRDLSGRRAFLKDLLSEEVQQLNPQERWRRFVKTDDLMGEVLGMTLVKHPEAPGSLLGKTEDTEALANHEESKTEAELRYDVAVLKLMDERRDLSAGAQEFKEKAPIVAIRRGTNPIGWTGAAKLALLVYLVKNPSACQRKVIAASVKTGAMKTHMRNLVDLHEHGWLKEDPECGTCLSEKGHRLAAKKISNYKVI